jgi:hypothetical protein
MKSPGFQNVLLSNSQTCHRYFTDGAASGTHHTGGSVANVVSNAGDAAAADDEQKAEEHARKSKALAEKMMGADDAVGLSTS